MWKKTMPVVFIKRKFECNQASGPRCQCGGIRRQGDMLNCTKSDSHRIDSSHWNPYYGKFCRLNDLQIVNLEGKERNEGEIWTLKENFKNIFENKTKN